MDTLFLLAISTEGTWQFQKTLVSCSYIPNIVVTQNYKVGGSHISVAEDYYSLIRTVRFTM